MGRTLNRMVTPSVRDPHSIGRICRPAHPVLAVILATLGAMIPGHVGPRGHLSVYGFSAGIQRNVSMVLIGFWFAKLWWWNRFSGGRSTSFFSITSLRKKHPEWFVADLGELLGLATRGEIRPRVAERIAF